MRTAVISSKTQTLELSLSTWKRLWTDLYWVYDDEPHPEGRDAVIEPNWISAWLIRKGSVRVHYDDATLKGCAGQWVFPPTGKRHQIFAPETRILSVNFTAQWSAQQELWAKRSAAVIPAQDSPALERAATRLLRSLPKPDTTIFRVMGQVCVFSHYARIAHCFQEWISCYIDALTAAGCALQPVNAADERVDTAVSLINSHPFRIAFREEAVAQQVGLSVRQLTRLFHDHLGDSPARYFDRRRLQRACELLLHDSIPIKELSYELGFSSLHYFSHWFKKRRGESPKTFRTKRKR